MRSSTGRCRAFVLRHRRQLDALDYDIRMPFDPISRTWKPRVRHRALPYRTVTSKHWLPFSTVTLSSPRRRDFDLYLYRAGKTRSFASSRRTGRFDRIVRVLPPGRYDIGVHATPAAADGRESASLWIDSGVLGRRRRAIARTSLPGSCGAGSSWDGLTRADADGAPTRARKRSAEADGLRVGGDRLGRQEPDVPEDGAEAVFAGAKRATAGHRPGRGGRS